MIKKRKRTTGPEEILFDDTARHDFLTGFHKRKVQRTLQAQEQAKKKEREERIEFRKKLREERKDQIKQHVEAVKAAIHGLNPIEKDDDDKEWEGISEASLEKPDHEAEYIDEDRYTTVTVSTVDVTREGFEVDDEEEGDGQKDQENADKDTDPKSDRKSGGKNTPKKPKVKKKQFRYLNKADRKVERVKERLGKKKKAEARKRS